MGQTRDEIEFENELRGGTNKINNDFKIEENIIHDAMTKVFEIIKADSPLQLQKRIGGFNNNFIKICEQILNILQSIKKSLNLIEEDTSLVTKLFNKLEKDKRDQLKRTYNHINLKKKIINEELESYMNYWTKVRNSGITEGFFILPSIRKKNDTSVRLYIKQILGNEEESVNKDMVHFLSLVQTLKLRAV